MQHPSAFASRPAGAPPRRFREHAYVLGHHGFVYTTLEVTTAETVRHPGVLLLSVDRSPFEVTLRDGRCCRTDALAIGPRVARRLTAVGVPLLSINVQPSSSWFPVLKGLRDHGDVALLDRSTFAGLDAAMAELHQGGARCALAQEVFDGAMTEARRCLPDAAVPDPRVRQLQRRLDTDPEADVGSLAHAFGCTPEQLARGFEADFGIPVAAYREWSRQRRVFDLLYTDRPLSEVAFESGFGDSPQFARAFQRWFGRSPSYSRNPFHVRIVTGD